MAVDSSLGRVAHPIGCPQGGRENQCLEVSAVEQCALFPLVSPTRLGLSV